MAGFAFARLKFPGRDLIFLTIFSTFLVSLPVIIVPLFILVQPLGMANNYVGLIVPAIFNAFGIFLLRQFYLGRQANYKRPRSLMAPVIGASCFR